jgi:Flp pilus assembly protein TadD
MIRAELQRASALIGAGRLHEAESIAQALIARYPDAAGPWQVLSTAHAKAGRLQDAVRCVERAIALAPTDVALYLQYAQQLLMMGRRREALKLADKLAATKLERADWNDSLASLLTYCEEPARALSFFERAVTLAPSNPDYLYNCATAQRMVGNPAAAEALLNQVIHYRPSDSSAYYMRADLRTQTATDNHIDEMISALNTKMRNAHDETLMCFAIAKELDDVANYDLAFRYLKQGCDRKRGTFTYHVEEDVSTIDHIIQTHDRVAIDIPGGLESTECIFVMGLPRTGTTLVEQILSSHGDVYGAGELPTFPAEVVRAVEQRAGRRLRKHEVVDMSLEVDAAQLGRSYIEATRPQTGRTPVFVDKQPMNYLYAGLIRRALPNARLIIVEREGMDACFAMYRTLFTGAYPFSYDLAELAAYYAAWHRLMRHWQAVLEDRLLRVQYERLVLDPEATIRRLLAHCRLPWDDACLAFHTQLRPVTTASAVQIRKPLYSSSVGKWRHYRTHLKPLQEALRQLEPREGGRLD